MGYTFFGVCTADDMVMTCMYVMLKCGGMRTVVHVDDFLFLEI